MSAVDKIKNYMYYDDIIQKDVIDCLKELINRIEIIEEKLKNSNIEVEKINEIIAPFKKIGTIMPNNFELCPTCGNFKGSCHCHTGIIKKY